MKRALAPSHAMRGARTVRDSHLISMRIIGNDAPQTSYVKDLDRQDSSS